MTMGISLENDVPNIYYIYIYRERERGGLDYYSADKPKTSSEDTIESNDRDDGRDEDRDDGRDDYDLKKKLVRNFISFEKHHT